MSFYIYDIAFLIVFSLLVGLFLWKRRKNLKREGIMYLYRTQVGVKFIDYVGGKYKKTLSVLGFIGIICGYGLMAGMIYFLYKLIYIYLFMPDVVRAIKIPPLMPLIPYLPEAFNISFLPPFYFTYWIIAIAVIAIFHEFAHGIIARRYDIKILTTGFGFLGPFLAAFVEPDEKQMETKPKYQQIAVLSAGVFVNFILAIIFFLMLSGFFVLAYVPAGAMFNTYANGIVDVNSIDKIGGVDVEGLNSKELLKIINKNNLTDNLILGSNGNTLELTKIEANGEIYYTTIEKLKLQLESEMEEVLVYLDLPAINAGLRGAIVQINEFEIKDYEDLSNAMKGFQPGEEIKIITKDIENNNEILEYNLVLEEDPTQEGRAVLGIGYQANARVLGKITDFFVFTKEIGTNYEPRFNADFILFIYNLIWWLALINLSVALINMWPVAIFDGGRMFMLTIWAITGSEKLGMWLFKFMTYVILGALLLLMVGWGSAWF